MMKIEYADLDGSNRKVLVSSTYIDGASGLNFYQNKLLVIEVPTQTLMLLNVTSETSSVYPDGVVENSTFMTPFDAFVFQSGKPIIFIYLFVIYSGIFHQYIVLVSQETLIYLRWKVTNRYIE